MKGIKYIAKHLFFVLLATIFGLGAVQAQDTEKEDKATQIKELLEAKHFVFRAQQALPIGGRSVILTSPYDVNVSGDTTRAYLPFYGRAYVAPINPGDAGIQFTSTNFDYKQTPLKKKRGWNIVIEPKDTQDARQLYLRVFENGSATLQVTSNNRQTISYNGYIVAKS